MEAADDILSADWPADEGTILVSWSRGKPGGQLSWQRRWHPPTGAHTKSRMRARAHGKLSLLLQAQDLNIIGRSAIFVVSPIVTNWFDYFSLTSLKMTFSTNA